MHVSGGCLGPVPRSTYAAGIGDRALRGCRLSHPVARWMSVTHRTGQGQPGCGSGNGLAGAGTMTQTCDLLDRVQTPAARVAASCERQHRRSPTRVFRRPCPVTVVIVIIIETRIPSKEKDNDRNGQGFRGWELACISQRAERTKEEDFSEADCVWRVGWVGRRWLSPGRHKACGTSPKPTAERSQVLNKEATEKINFKNPPLALHCPSDSTTSSFFTLFRAQRSPLGLFRTFRPPVAQFYSLLNSLQSEFCLYHGRKTVLHEAITYFS